MYRRCRGCLVSVGRESRRVNVCPERALRAFSLSLGKCAASGSLYLTLVLHFVSHMRLQRFTW